jgi:class 3 adenylate cyclase/CheY-like chemotaxis protein
MTRRAKILIVDDVPENIKLLVAMLTDEAHEIVTAASGAEALEMIEKESPDLVLLDVVMPKMDGYAVCRRIRECDGNHFLPVVMISALDPSEESRNSMEAGADGFLERPVKRRDVVARVRALLRIKEVHDKVELQAQQLAERNSALERQLEVQAAELDRLGRLKRFFSPHLAEMIVSEKEDLLKSHRRNITVVFLDLRGFTAFAEAVDPEEVMGVLWGFHGEMGRLTVQYEATLERFTGDGMMIFLNDPVEVEDPENRAVRMALDMRDASERLRVDWRKQGYELDFGVGIAAGYATLGAIGFEGRYDYGAIGRVTNLAARLCDEAPPGNILISNKVFGAVEDVVKTEPFGDLSLKGFQNPIPARNVLGLIDPSGP